MSQDLTNAVIGVCMGTLIVGLFAWMAIHSLNLRPASRNWSDCD